MLNKEVEKKVRDLTKIRVPYSERRFVNRQIGSLLHSLDMRTVKNLEIVTGIFPGWGDESPARHARGKKQRYVDQDVLWTLFANGKRGDYIVYMDFPK